MALHFHNCLCFSVPVLFCFGALVIESDPCTCWTVNYILKLQPEALVCLGGWGMGVGTHYVTQVGF